MNDDTTMLTLQRNRAAIASASPQPQKPNPLDLAIKVDRSAAAADRQKFVNLVTETMNTQQMNWLDAWKIAVKSYPTEYDAMAKADFLSLANSSEADTPEKPHQVKQRELRQKLVDCANEIQADTKCSSIQAWNEACSKLADVWQELINVAGVNGAQARYDETGALANSK